MNEIKLDALILYAEQLVKAGLDGKQIYHKFIMVCNEIEKELGLDGNNI